MDQQQRLSWSLLLLRWGVFIVMLFWTLDKFVRPEHSARVFEGFYGLSGFGSTAFYIIGGWSSHLSWLSLPDYGSVLPTA